MAIRYYKPTSPSRRGMSTLIFKEITKKNEPEKSLLCPINRTSARNNQGRMTVRFRGGGHKRHYRLIDFKRDKIGIMARVASIEYDPNRSANIALLHYIDGEKRYILAPLGLQVGDMISSGEEAEIRIGSALPLRVIPVGMTIHNVEMKKGKGGQLVRTAGGAAQLSAKDDDYAHIKMPSGEIRLIHMECMATIGQIGNVDRVNVKIGKAGRNRWFGKKPHNRGVTMNPVDHPMGGGEGKASGGRHPVSPTGVPAKGYRTRKHKLSDKMIVKRRYK